MPKNILTTNEAADLLGIARTSLINWVERGEVKYTTTPGGHRRFRRTDLEAFAKSRDFDLHESDGKSADKENSQTKVLIVDDDDDFRQFAQDCLNIAGDFAVKETTNGMDAALITGSWKPNIILLDLRMPKMNGIDFCKQIREKDDFKNTKIVIVSAYADSEIKEEAQGLAIDSIVSKPIGIKDFVEKIRALV